MSGNGRLERADVLEDLNIGYLTWSGLWKILNDYRDTGRKNWVIKMWMVVVVIFYGPLLAATIAGPIYIEKNLEGITLMLLNPLTLAQMALKFSVVWSGIQVQSQLLDLMRKDFLACVPADKKAKCDEIIRQAAVQSNFLVKLAITMNITTSIIWDSLPVLRSEFVRQTLGISIFGTPKGPNKVMGTVYPVIDFNKPYRTQIVNSYEWFISGSAAFMISICEALLIQVLAMMVGHLKVIAFLLSSLKPSGDPKRDTEILLNHVREHQKLLKMGDDVQNLYNSLITTQLSTGLLILILAIFNASLGSDKGDLIEAMKFASYTLYTLAEVYIYCYFGGELEIMSEEVCFAAYCSEWYGMNVHYRKCLLMTMVRSQKSITLKAGKLVPVNMAAFKNIMQTAYSSSMLMFRITKGDKGL